MAKWPKIVPLLFVLAIVIGVYYPPAGEVLVMMAPVMGVEIGPMAEVLPDLAELARRTSGTMKMAATFGLSFGSVFAVGKAYDRYTRD